MERVRSLFYLNKTPMKRNKREKWVVLPFASLFHYTHFILLFPSFHTLIILCILCSVVVNEVNGMERNKETSERTKRENACSIPFSSFIHTTPHKERMKRRERKHALISLVCLLYAHFCFIVFFVFSLKYFFRSVWSFGLCELKIRNACFNSSHPTNHTERKKYFKLNTKKTMKQKWA
jgi:hypothetical protein